MVSCRQAGTERSNMEEVGVIEIVTGRPKAGVSLKDAQKAMSGLNRFVQEQPGFISRSSAVKGDGVLIDVVYWKDMSSALNASEKAMSSGVLLAISEHIEESSMTLEHYEVFNQIEKQK